MKIIGITGGIGSGKSTVVRIFNSEYDVPVYYSDIRVKLLYMRNKELKEIMVNKFSPSILTNHEIDISKLGKIIFNSKKKQKEVNEIIRPYITTDLQNWKIMYEGIYQFVLLESAILYQTGYDKICDKVILVKVSDDKQVDEQIRINRVKLRDKRTDKQIKKIIAIQNADLKEFTPDFTIYNFDKNRKKALYSQVELIYQELCLAKEEPSVK